MLYREYTTRIRFEVVFVFYKFVVDLEGDEQRFRHFLSHIYEGLNEQLMLFILQ
jgi:hypothetical protein